MKIIEEIKHISSVVEYFLENHPEFRDSDTMLMAQIWYSQVMDKTMSVTTFLKHVGHKDLVNSESIRRCRQVLQANNPHLRGENWKKRHEDAEEFSQEILKL